MNDCHCTNITGKNDPFIELQVESYSVTTSAGAK